MNGILQKQTKGTKSESEPLLPSLPSVQSASDLIAVPVLLERELVELIREYAVVHRRSVNDMVRETVLEKFAPNLAELGAAA